MVSSTRKAIMYSFTRCSMAQLARMQMGINSAVSTTNGMEMPSTPMPIAREAAEPGALLEELETRQAAIEIEPDGNGQGKRQERREQRGPAHVAARDRVIPADHQHEQGADERQKRYQRKNGPAGHHSRPANMYQVANSATPINMANA